MNIMYVTVGNPRKCRTTNRHLQRSRTASPPRRFFPGSPLSTFPLLPLRQIDGISPLHIREMKSFLAVRRHQRGSADVCRGCVDFEGSAVVIAALPRQPKGVEEDFDVWWAGETGEEAHEDYCAAAVTDVLTGFALEAAVFTFCEGLVGGEDDSGSGVVCEGEEVVRFVTVGEFGYVCFGFQQREERGVGIVEPGLLGE